LGALVAAQITGRAACLETFFHGPGAMFLVTLACFGFSLARMAVRQFSEGEPLQPAWFLIMLSGGCQLAGAICVQILSVSSPLNPLAYGANAWTGANPADIRRFGLLVGGPLQMLLLAGGLAYVLRLCVRTHIAIRCRPADGLFLLIAAAGAYLEIRHLAGATRAGQVLTTYDVLLVSGGPLLMVLLVQATLIRRFMTALGGGMIAKCWSSFAAAIFLAALGNLGFWLANYGYLPAPLAQTTWYIWLLSSTAFALGPGWQIEAVQSASGEVGVSRFSPFAMSLAALRLLKTGD